MKSFAFLLLCGALFVGCGPVGVRTANIDDIYWEGAAWTDQSEVVVETINRRGVYQLKWMVESEEPYLLFVNENPVDEGRAGCGRATYDLTWGARAEPAQRNRFVIRREGARAPLRSVVDILYSDGSEDIFTTTP